MTIIIIVAVLAFVGLGATCWYAHAHLDHCGMWPGWTWVLAAILGITLLASSITGGIQHYAPQYDERVCARFADESGRETKFARYGFWSWECLVETDGGWVSRDRIIKVDD